MIFCSFRGYFLFFSLQRVVLLSHWLEKISEVIGRGIWKYYFLIFIFMKDPTKIQIGKIWIHIVLMLTLTCIGWNNHSNVLIITILWYKHHWSVPILNWNCFLSDCNRTRTHNDLTRVWQDKNPQWYCCNYEKVAVLWNNHIRMISKLMICLKIMRVDTKACFPLHVMSITP